MNPWNENGLLLFIEKIQRLEMAVSLLDPRLAYFKKQTCNGHNCENG